ncbi:hypothetical protein GA0074692_1662 [Micromonospora pallida]|uniref:Uncharacterized protein n=1 Tax=Micromonospora pallida TaxID=145854 RepID=A0A1C6S367_9ACTN|nr:hypothetical protein GA0074692_1662 [Micromonospora pallida]
MKITVVKVKASTHGVSQHCVLARRDGARPAPTAR